MLLSKGTTAGVSTQGDEKMKKDWVWGKARHNQRKNRARQCQI